MILGLGTLCAMVMTYSFGYVFFGGGPGRLGRKPSSYIKILQIVPCIWIGVFTILFLARLGNESFTAGCSAGSAGVCFIVGIVLTLGLLPALVASYVSYITWRKFTR